MKFVLTIIMCSFYEGVCLEPHTFPKGYDTMYDCLMDGYEKSSKKTEELGRKEVNKYGVFMKFDCKLATQT